MAMWDGWPGPVDYQKQQFDKTLQEQGKTINNLSMRLKQLEDKLNSLLNPTIETESNKVYALVKMTKHTLDDWENQDIVMIFTTKDLAEKDKPQNTGQYPFLETSYFIKEVELKSNL
jgi:hypothetical protein